MRLGDSYRGKASFPAGAEESRGRSLDRQASRTGALCASFLVTPLQSQSRWGKICIPPTCCAARIGSLPCRAAPEFLCASPIWEEDGESHGHRSTAVPGELSTRPAKPVLRKLAKAKPRPRGRTACVWVSEDPDMI